MNTPRLVFLTVALLFSLGCCAKKPILVLYCEKLSADGHCEKWAEKTHPSCVHDQYGDCTANTK